MRFILPPKFERRFKSTTVQDVNEKAVGAGRGLLFITAAKLWFLIAGYVIQFGLPRALGSPENFGLYILVMNVVAPVNNVLVTATIQGVSKFCSETEGRVPAVTRAALRMQVLLGGGTALVFFLLAPLIAWFEHDPAIVGLLRLAAGVVLAYSFYAVFVGAANGARHFHKQAALDIGYATLRASLVVGGALLFHSALGAIAGFVTASASILLLASLFVGVGEKPAQPFSSRELARFFAGLAAYLLIINLLMFVDGLLLKRLVAEHVMASGLGAEAAAKAANAQEGFYGAAQNVARIPYQLILAVTFVIFPLVSRSTFEKDSEKTKRYVAATVRYSLLVVVGMAVALGSRPTAIMRLFYKPEYAVGAHAAAVLLAGYVCFSLFTIAGTIINSSGRTRPTLVIGAITLAVAVGANWGAVGWALANGRDPLLWAAAATTASMGFGMLLAGVYLQREFGAFLSPLSVARTALCALVGMGLGRIWPNTGFLGGKVGALLSAATCGLAFLTAAVATGELRPREILKLRRGE
jgi:stage V sporulation protein B